MAETRELDLKKSPSCKTSRFFKGYNLYLCITIRTITMKRKLMKGNNYPFTESATRLGVA